MGEQLNGRAVSDQVDCRGTTIRLGDILRTPHFVGSRKRQHYLYHVVCWNEKEQCLEAVPATNLAFGNLGGGRFWIKHGLAKRCGSRVIETILEYVPARDVDRVLAVAQSNAATCAATPGGEAKQTEGT